MARQNGAGGRKPGAARTTPLDLGCDTVPKPAQQTAASAALQPPNMASTVEQGGVFDTQPVMGVSIEHDDANGSLTTEMERPLQCSRLGRFTKKLKQFQDSQAGVTYYDVD